MPTCFVFDAYGTLFDVHAAAAAERASIGATWEKLSQTWRAKHLEYTWVYSLAGREASFWSLAEQSLDFAIASVGGIPEGVRARLLASYRRMQAYPEVAVVLSALKARGALRVILSNGDPDMLADAVSAAGLDGSFDAVISVREAGTFKPAPVVYRRVLERFGIARGDVSFQSSNRWDIAGAAGFGFHTVCINRSAAPDEYPDLPAGRIVRDLHGLLET